MSDQVCFVTLVSSPIGERSLRLMIESLREFGGVLSRSPVLVFHAAANGHSPAVTGLGDVTLVPLAMEKPGRHYFFSAKACACARAEEMMNQDVGTLVWMGTNTLVVDAPALLRLDSGFGAAFRPVHVQNIGLLSQDPLDDFWTSVYQQVGVDDTAHSIESFVDAKTLRPYFNTHFFSVDPSVGLLQAWWEHFQVLITDQAFQSGPCRDEVHQIFLHQAVLCALLLSDLEWERIRILPPEYSYPLHFHPEVPDDRRAETINRLVCPVYEGSFAYPETLNGIGVDEPLASWLAERGLNRVNLRS